MTLIKSKYRDIKFKTKNDFECWLARTAKYKIEIEDHGQDFLTWWIDERGEVLHSDAQSFAWNGKIVALAPLLKLNMICFTTGEQLNYNAKKVTELKAKKS